MTLQFGKGMYEKEVQSFMDAMDAIEYKLPHPLDRPGQPDALDWIMNLDKPFGILRAPTGFGKSPLAAATSIEFRTLALVLHKSLQSANYRDQYDFDILYGEANYPCVRKNNREKKRPSFLPHRKFTAYDCDNYKCDCPYQKQHKICLRSQRVSLNYAKFLASRSFSTSLFERFYYNEGDNETGTRLSFDERFFIDGKGYYEPTYLFLDEAHNLPNIVTNFIGLTLNWDNEFLKLWSKIKPEINERLGKDKAMGLFMQCARAVKENEPEQSKDLEKWRKWKRMDTKIQTTNNILRRSLKDWYYETNDKSLIIKPLTAKYHFKKLFGVADKVILMSATIGPSIAERLGLEDDEWDYHEVPNPWPVPSRLVYDLGGPAINWKSSISDMQEQAYTIAGILDIKKSGVIHVTSKAQAWELVARVDIEKPMLNFHIPTVGMGTEEQYQEWLEVRKPGTYCISWNFHEGVDLGGDDISIIAKVPWINFSSNYERAKMEYDQQWYLEQAAMKFEQACGRTRRGKREHYLPGAKQVYIADSSWHRLKTLLSDDFRKSIRRYNGK